MGDKPYPKTMGVPSKPDLDDKEPVEKEKKALDADYKNVKPAVERLATRSQRFFLADHALTSGDGYPMTFLGQKLLGDYLLPFEIASVLLLVVMIGAAYLAKARRRDEGEAAAKAFVSDELSRQAREWS